MRKPFSLAKWVVAVLLLSSLTSCEDILEQYFPKPTPPTIPPPTATLDIPFYALSENGRRLDAFSTKNPTTPTASVALTTTGDRPGDKMLGIDFRPATGQLYGVSGTSRVYVINPQTGVARLLIGSANTEKTEACICADPISMDFDPSTDRIRVVAFNGRNRVINPETGVVEAIETHISPRPTLSDSPIRAMAYSNNVAGTTSTTLYAINALDQQLYRVTSAKEGVVEAIGKLNLLIVGAGGMDIDAKSGTALAVFPTTPNNTPILFTVDLTTGAANALAQYTEMYRAIAIPTQPVAYAVLSNLGVISKVTYNNLLIFNPNTPSSSVKKPITGLLSDETIQGLDFRPANGQLYALTSNNRLVTINAATAAATLVGALSIPVGAKGSSSDFVIGFDFNPVADHIRVVGGYSDINARINPLDASVTIDIPPNPFSTILVSAAYDNNFAGATTTDLYTIDYTADKLYRMNPPNAGTLVQVGTIGIRSGRSDFDIGGTSNIGYVIMDASGGGIISRKLYHINLSTGAPTTIGDVGFTGNWDGDISGFTVGLGF